MVELAQKVTDRLTYLLNEVEILQSQRKRLDINYTELRDLKSENFDLKQKLDRALVRLNEEGVEKSMLG